MMQIGYCFVPQGLSGFRKSESSSAPSPPLHASAAHELPWYAGSGFRAQGLGFKGLGFRVSSAASAILDEMLSRLIPEVRVSEPDKKATSDLSASFGFISCYKKR